MGTRGAKRREGQGEEVIGPSCSPGPQRGTVLWITAMTDRKTRGEWAATGGPCRSSALRLGKPTRLLMASCASNATTRYDDHSLYIVLDPCRTSSPTSPSMSCPQLRTCLLGHAA